MAVDFGTLAKAVVEQACKLRAAIEEAGLKATVGTTEIFDSLDLATNADKIVSALNGLQLQAAFAQVAEKVKTTDLTKGDAEAKKQAVLALARAFAAQALNEGLHAEIAQIPQRLKDAGIKIDEAKFASGVATLRSIPGLNK